MSDDEIRGQQDAFKRWRDKAEPNRIKGATELPYIKSRGLMHRHREMFKRPVVKKIDGVVKCGCGKRMHLVIDEFYCDDCHVSVMEKEVV
jgi:hypothetical protein